jgi:Hsp90 protein
MMRTHHLCPTSLSHYEPRQTPPLSHFRSLYFSIHLSRSLALRSSSSRRESTADSSFTVSKDPRGNTLGRGTEITMYLKEDAQEFLQQAKLEELVRRYSEFITFPIQLYKKTQEVVEEEEEDDETDDEKSETDADDLTVEDEEEEKEKEPSKSGKVLVRIVCIPLYSTQDKSRFMNSLISCFSLLNPRNASAGRHLGLAPREQQRSYLVPREGRYFRRGVPEVLQSHQQRDS